ncbi:MAG TPA: hypothetical protein VNB06_13920 [Thermoanaerobaculia bacterium]|nr:hypothetical protein [Thermoanaerobaculia bacterium]
MSRAERDLAESGLIRTAARPTCVLRNVGELRFHSGGLELVDLTRSEHSHCRLRKHFQAGSQPLELSEQVKADDHPELVGVGKTVFSAASLEVVPCLRDDGVELASVRGREAADPRAVKGSLGGPAQQSLGSGVAWRFFMAVSLGRQDRLGSQLASPERGQQEGVLIGWPLEIRTVAAELLVASELFVRDGRGGSQPLGWLGVCAEGS